MKTRVLFLTLIFMIPTLKPMAQSLQVSPELKELISLSVIKDRKVADKELDKQIAQEQQKAVRSAYIPKVELGGKYAFAYSSVNSNIGDITGLKV